MHTTHWRKTLQQHNNLQHSNNTTYNLSRTTTHCKSNNNYDNSNKHRSSWADLRNREQTTTPSPAQLCRPEWPALSCKDDTVSAV